MIILKRKNLIKLGIFAVALPLIAIGCSNKDSAKGIKTDSFSTQNPATVKIGASNTPHAVILEHLKPELEKEGVRLDIVKYQDYYLPNKNLQDEEIDLNYFQHKPFLEKEIKEKGYNLSTVAEVHLEPIGLYSKRIKNISELKTGATVLVSNNQSEWGRILKILQDNNLVKVKENIDIKSATFEDIAENPKQLKFKYDNDPAIMAQYYNNDEADLIAINTNFAVDSGINPTKDAIILESGENNPYNNILVARTEDKDREIVNKIASKLESAETAKFISENFNGSVIPARKG